MPKGHAEAWHGILLMTENIGGDKDSGESLNTYWHSPATS
jgi:hypothetical protein